MRSGPSPIDRTKYFLPTEDDALFSAVCAEILAVAPQANQGYSQRKDNVFRQDPSRLLGDESSDD